MVNVMKDKKKIIIFVSIGVLVLIILFIIILKLTEKPVNPDDITIEGMTDYLDVNVNSSKIEVENINYSYNLSDYKGDVKNVVSISGCASDDNFNLVTVLTSSGLYTLYVGNSYIKENIDNNLKLVKISDAENIKKIYYAETGDTEKGNMYDELPCFRYPFVEYKDGSIKAIAPKNIVSDTDKILANKDDYKLVDIK